MKTKLSELNVFTLGSLDNLHLRILEELACEIASPIARIFNKSNLLLSDERIGNIVSVFKKGKRVIQGNAR